MRSHSAHRAGHVDKIGPFWARPKQWLPRSYTWYSNGTPARRNAAANFMVCSTGTASSVIVCTRNEGGVDFVTCSSFESNAIRSADGFDPRRFVLDPA